MGIVLYIALVGNVFIIPIIFVGFIWIQVFLYHTSLIGILSFLIGILSFLIGILSFLSHHTVQNIS